MRGRVAFFMGGGARIIRGGQKVLFIHANFLAQSGVEVSIFFPASNSANRQGPWKAARLARYALGAVSPRLYLPSAWLQFHPGIETRWVLRARPDHARHFALNIIADHAVAADLLDAGATRALPNTLYLFQEYEYYMAGGPAARAAIERTLRSAAAVVAISPVTHSVALRFAGPERVHLVNNGVELDRYFLRDGGARVARRGIGFPFREEQFKRTADIVSALADLRRRNGLRDYSCWAYGSARAPQLPPWIEYHCRPSSQQLCELLNRSAMFVVASQYEGWGLPGAEAMACGAALVTSRNGGCEAYARHGENALTYSPGDVQALTAAIAQLIEEPELRTKLAVAGHRSIQELSWAEACPRFLAVVDTMLQAAGRR